MNETATLPTPGWLGRGVRLVLAAFFLYWFVGISSGYRLGGHPNPSDLLAWVALVYVAWALPEIVNLGFRVHWGPWPRYAFLSLLLLGGAVDLALGGGLPGPVFGLVFFATLAYAFGHLGLSFLVAAIVASPG